MIRTNFYITELQKKALEKIKKEKGIDQSFVIRKALDEYIKKNIKK